MKTPGIIYGNTCPRPIKLAPATAGELEELIFKYRERLTPAMTALAPMTRENQQVILDNCHYLSVRYREALLLRLASERLFYAPLFYELADRAGRDALLRAEAIAKKAGNMGAAAMADDFLGDAPERENRRVGGVLEGLICFFIC